MLGMNIFGVGARLQARRIDETIVTYMGMFVINNIVIVFD